MRKLQMTRISNLINLQLINGSDIISVLHNRNLEKHRLMNKSTLLINDVHTYKNYILFKIRFKVRLKHFLLILNPR